MFEQIEWLNREIEGGNEYAIARPSKVRQAAYKEMHLSLPEPMRAEAYRLYALLG